MAASMLAGGILLSFWVQATTRVTPPAPGRAPPFRPGVLQGVTGDGSVTSFDLGGGVVVLYLDDNCHFCAREVRAWYRASGGAHPPGLLLVRRPAAGVPHPGIVPPAWGAFAVNDPSGSIAAALGVTAVPFLAVSDSAGAVRDVTLGLTPDERLHTLLETLTRSQGKDPP